MYNVGIIGAASDKFTASTFVVARDLVARLIVEAQVRHGAVTVVSGGCHLGGVDALAEEVGRGLAVPVQVFKPVVHQWNPPREYGYKARNLDIADGSDELHVVLVSGYPPGYAGVKYEECYHCQVATHVKSGACWTALRAIRLGKTVWRHVIALDGKVESESGERILRSLGRS